MQDDREAIWYTQSSLTSSTHLRKLCLHPSNGTFIQACPLLLKYIRPLTLVLNTIRFRDTTTSRFSNSFCNKPLFLLHLIRTSSITQLTFFSHPVLSSSLGNSLITHTTRKYDITSSYSRKNKRNYYKRSNLVKECFQEKALSFFTLGSVHAKADTVLYLKTFQDWILATLRKNLDWTQHQRY